MVEGPVQRRLAAILAADVVGYTRLMGNDEAGTLRRLTGLRRSALEPLIADHHGRIVKLMGDGLLVEFSSVVDATACAVAWQARMAEYEPEVAKDTRLEFRIGINLGDVIVEGDDIYGDGVNIAARLESLAEPGGICLSGEAYRLAKGKVEARFEDMGERQLKNIADPVRAYRVVAAESNEARASPKPVQSSLPERPSVAILPLTEFGPNAVITNFGEGLAADIATELSRTGTMSVTGHHETQSHELKRMGVEEIGRTLGVRYVLSGTVRQADDRIRVTAELLDVRTGRPLWSERYDRPLADPFAVQDEISRAIAGIAETIMYRAEMDRISRSPTKDARVSELMLRAWRTCDKGTEQENRDAERDCEAAIDLDADYAEAYGLLSWIHWFAVMSGWAENSTATLRRALDYAEKGVSLNPKEYDSIGARSACLLALGRYDAAERVVEELSRKLPNHPYATMYRGLILRALGRHEEALGLVRRSMEINPEHDQWAWLNLGLCLFCLERYDEAIEALEQFKAQAKFPFIHLFLAAAYAATNRREEAGAEAVLLGGALEKLAAAAYLWFRQPADRERLAVWARRAGKSAHGPGKPSIAVLPFNNMSGDPDQEYFADGITEDIITELARNRGLFVIARNSSFAFKGTVPNIGEVGRKLGVHYVVEGSVRKVGNRVRITAQLIEAATGNHVWAERYDRDLQDIFAVQDEVTRSITVAVPGHLESDIAIASRRKPTDSLGAYDHYLRGIEIVNRWRNDDINLAIAEFENAVKLDSMFARALASLGHMHLRIYWNTNDKETLRQANSETELAVRLDGADVRCLSIRGMCLLSNHDFDNALKVFERGLQLSPNDPELNIRMAYYLVCTGEPDKALDRALVAISANPIFPPPSYQEAVGMAHMMARRYDAAFKSYAGVASPSYYIHVWAAGCLAKLGRFDEAVAQSRLASKQNPEWPKDDWADEYKNPEDREHMRELFRLAVDALAQT